MSARQRMLAIAVAAPLAVGAVAQPGLAQTSSRAAARSATAPGIELTHTRFDAVAAAVVDARVWGGIHWRASSETGRALGRRIARYGLAHGLRPAARCRGAS
jgi:hypothetical protein